MKKQPDKVLPLGYLCIHANNQVNMSIVHRLVLNAVRGEEAVETPTFANLVCAAATA